MMTDAEFAAAIAAAKARGELLWLATQARKRGDDDQADQLRLLWEQWEAEDED